MTSEGSYPRVSLSFNEAPGVTVHEAFDADGEPIPLERPIYLGRDRCGAFHSEYGFTCILPAHVGPHFDGAGGHWTKAGQLGDSDGYTRAIVGAQEDANALGSDLEELRRGVEQLAHKLVQPALTVGQREVLCEEVSAELLALGGFPPIP